MAPCQAITSSLKHLKNLSLVGTPQRLHQHQRNNVSIGSTRGLRHRNASRIRIVAPLAALFGSKDGKDSNQTSTRLGPPQGAASGGASTSSENMLDWSRNLLGSLPDPTLRKNLDKYLNVGVLATVGIIGASRILSVDQSVWEVYQQAVASNPVETKAMISGVVYSFGDLIAQTYEGRDIGDWDRARVIRSGLCGLLAHGPLSHLYYLGLDHVFTSQTLISSDSLLIPMTKMAIDQTVWSVFWNSTYYILLGLLKFETPSVIAKTVKSSWWDLLKAGWRLWPLVHVVTYGIIPVQHRLLFVDAVELVWVSILSLYGQQQREKAALVGGAPAVVACALPGVDGGGDPAEEILRSFKAEHEICFEHQDGHQTCMQPAEVYAEALVQGE